MALLLALATILIELTMFSAGWSLFRWLQGVRISVTAAPSGVGISEGAGGNETPERRLKFEMKII